MPKNKQLSAMDVFMQDMRPLLEKKYKKKYRVPFDSELFNLCKPIYKGLSDDQKEYYSELARTARKDAKEERKRKEQMFWQELARLQHEAMRKQIEALDKAIEENKKNENSKTDEKYHPATSWE
uniref:HMG box domain-containing protein n=1 Tax=Cacopsylla melanoneura TaxID=428564 RepID=A0A8D8SJD7_9HEMI